MDDLRSVRSEVDREGGNSLDTQKLAAPSASVPRLSVPSFHARLLGAA